MPGGNCRWQKTGRKKAKRRWTKKATIPASSSTIRAVPAAEEITASRSTIKGRRWKSTSTARPWRKRRTPTRCAATNATGAKWRSLLRVTWLVTTRRCSTARARNCTTRWRNIWTPTGRSSATSAKSRSLRRTSSSSTTIPSAICTNSKGQLPEEEEEPSSWPPPPTHQSSHLYRRRSGRNDPSRPIRPAPQEHQLQLLPTSPLRPAGSRGSATFAKWPTAKDRRWTFTSGPSSIRPEPPNCKNWQLPDKSTWRGRWSNSQLPTSNRRNRQRPAARPVRSPSTTPRNNNNNNWRWPSANFTACRLSRFSSSNSNSNWSSSTTTLLAGSTTGPASRWWPSRPNLRPSPSTTTPTTTTNWISRRAAPLACSSTCWAATGSSWSCSSTNAIRSNAVLANPNSSSNNNVATSSSPSTTTWTIRLAIRRKKRTRRTRWRRTCPQTRLPKSSAASARFATKAFPAFGSWRRTAKRSIAKWSRRIASSSAPTRSNGRPISTLAPLRQPALRCRPLKDYHHRATSTGLSQQRHSNLLLLPSRPPGPRARRLQRLHPLRFRLAQPTSPAPPPSKPIRLLLLRCNNNKQVLLWPSKWATCKAFSTPWDWPRSSSSNSTPWWWASLAWVFTAPLDSVSTCRQPLWPPWTCSRRWWTLSWWPLDNSTPSKPLWPLPRTIRTCSRPWIPVDWWPSSNRCSSNSNSNRAPAAVPEAITLSSR